MIRLLFIVRCLIFGFVPLTRPVGSFNPEAALLTYGLNISDNKYSSPSTNIISNIGGSKSASSGCALACSVLSSNYENTVSYQGSTSYNLLQSTYWSGQQADIKPFCIFQPLNNTQVAAALLLSGAFECKFAVRSGGHALLEGASNIQDGITVDFSQMKDIVLSPDRSIASIGPGNTWYNVYTALEPKNLTVLGGRISSIGVGGLILGGGISFLSNLHGWACDNVVNFEVVTSTGQIINASSNTNPDLYFALRGGGNNFGIVTRFDIKTYSQGPMWGGTVFYNISHSAAIISAYMSYGLNSPSDPNASLMLSYAYWQGSFLINADLEHALPRANPAIFSPFKMVPALADTTAVGYQSELINVDSFELIPALLNANSSITSRQNQMRRTDLNVSSNSRGGRQTWWTATFDLDKNMTSFIVSAFMTAISTSPMKNAQAFLPAAVLQVLTAGHLDGNTGNPNPLGLKPSDAPLILFNLAFSWSSANDDPTILSLCGDIIDAIVTEGKRRGLYREFMYMNYASERQTGGVFKGYGEGNFRKLVDISRKWDPDGVFQKLQPRGIKLDGLEGLDGYYDGSQIAPMKPIGKYVFMGSPSLGGRDGEK